jgi:hypothetical protein
VVTAVTVEALHNNNSLNNPSKAQLFNKPVVSAEVASAGVVSVAMVAQCMVVLVVSVGAAVTVVMVVTAVALHLNKLQSNSLLHHQFKLSHKQSLKLSHKQSHKLSHKQSHKVFLKQSHNLVHNYKLIKYQSN